MITNFSAATCNAALIQLGLDPALATLEETSPLAELLRLAELAGVPASEVAALAEKL